ncbi:MAG: 7TM diverse intracellular signaling domain-containing protein [Mariprofundaceae bacterium]
MRWYLWVSLLILMPFCMSIEGQAEAVHDIHAAWFIKTDAAIMPPATDLHWRQLQLPHSWAEDEDFNAADMASLAWYKLNFNLPEASSALRPDTLWDVHFPHISMNARVYLNGSMIGHAGSFELIGHTGLRPLSFSLPYPLLHAGNNELSIRLMGYPALPQHQSGLGTVSLGAHKLIAEVYEKRLFEAVIVNQLITLFAFGLAAFMLFVWLATRREPAYGWMALACCCWAVVNLQLAITDSDIPLSWWDRMFNLPIDIMALALTLFARRFTDVSYAWPDRMLIGSMVLLPVIYAMLSFAHIHALIVAIHFVTLSLLFLVVGFLTKCFLVRRDAATGWCLSGFFILLLSFGHDFILFAGKPSLITIYTFPYGLAAMFLFFLYAMLTHFGQNLASVRLGNLQLENSLGEQEIELLTQRVIEKERRLVMNELASGLVGHLIRVMAEARRANATQLAFTLRETLLELRQIVGAQVHGETFLEQWGDLRGRMNRADVNIHWQDNVGDGVKVPANVAVHIIKIVEEGIANAIKHARSQGISCCISSLEGDGRQALLVEVRDEGVGIQDGAKGRGIDNMYFRARKADGHLEINSCRDGTTLRLTVPICI